MWENMKEYNDRSRQKSYNWDDSTKTWKEVGYRK